MTRTEDHYPHELAGPAADPPQNAAPDIVDAWRAYEADERADAETLFGAGDWRPAPAIVELFAEANAANPRRDKTSDGIIADTRHAARKSGHNPDARGVVVAGDVDVDGLDMAAAVERARLAVLAGKLPQLVGGYIISAARITAPDFTGWRHYTGENPHVTHGHFETAHDPERADDRRPWNIWTAPRAPAARPTPAKPAKPTPAPAPRPPAQDLRGRAFDLRGEQGAAGPRVRGLQRFLVRVYPAYARNLAVDGVWGPRTTAVLREFAQRSGVRSADGANIGAQVARKLYLVGFRG